MKKTIIIILFLTANAVWAQEKDISNKYPEDFDYFIENLLATHPDPYTAFGNTIGFYQEKQKIREEIKNVNSDEKFVFLLNKFVSKLEDGHTLINKPSSSDIKQSKYLPVRFKVASDKLFIRNTTKEYKTLIGKPIIAINDIPMDSMLNLVKLYYPAENISGSYTNLINLITEKVSCNELFGDSSKHIKLTYREKTGNENIEVPYEDKIDLLIQTSTIKQPKENGLIDWAMIGENKNIAYFQWNSMTCREHLEKAYKYDPKNSEWIFQWIYGSYLKEKRTGNVEKDIKQVPSLYEQFYLMLKAMQEKKSDYLIIDLRNNSGGMTPLIEPLLYILYGDKYINYDFDAAYYVKLSPLFLKKYGITIEEYNNGNQTNFVLGDYRSSGFGNLEGTNYAAKVSKVANGYDGFGGDFVKKSYELNMHPQIIVLTSVNTFSAAYHFTYCLKKLGNTSIVGVASRQTGNSFMESTPIELPHTKLTGSISNAVQILYKNDPKTGKLLHPDYEMNWNDFEKYQFDKESEVLKAIELIESGKINTH